MPLLSYSPFSVYGCCSSLECTIPLAGHWKAVLDLNLKSLCAQPSCCLRTICQRLLRNRWDANTDKDLMLSGLSDQDMTRSAMFTCIPKKLMLLYYR